MKLPLAKSCFIFIFYLKKAVMSYSFLWCFQFWEALSYAPGYASDQLCVFIWLSSEQLHTS